MDRITEAYSRKYKKFKTINYYEGKIFRYGVGEK